MKSFSLLFFLFLSNVFASESTYVCKNLINGNANGKAYTIGKSIDLVLKIDAKSEEVLVDGKLVKKEGQYNREDEVDEVWTKFTSNKDFSQKNNLITIKSFNRNLLLCNLSQSPCRHWESMVFNTETKEAILETSHSYGAYFGEEIYKYSFKFGCSKI